MAVNKNQNSKPAPETATQAATSKGEKPAVEMVHLYSRMHAYFISTVPHAERRMMGRNNEVVTEVDVQGKGFQFNKCRCEVPKAEFEELKKSSKWRFWGDIDFTDAKTLYLWVINDDPRGAVFIQHMHKSLILADVLNQKDKLYQEGPFHIAMVEELEKICGVPSRKKPAAQMAVAIAQDA
jgi:hypothetical protein